MIMKNNNQMPSKLNNDFLEELLLAEISTVIPQRIIKNSTYEMVKSNDRSRNSL